VISSKNYNQLTENPSKDNINALVDQMLFILDTDKDVTFKILCIRYTVAVIRHYNVNLDVYLSGFPLLIKEAFQRIVVKKLGGEQNKDVISLIINFVPHLFKYNKELEIETYVNTLKFVECDVNVIVKIKFIYSLSNNVLLPTLTLGFTQQQVQLLVSF
jgi:hypothetical protein